MWQPLGTDVLGMQRPVLVPPCTDLLGNVCWWLSKPSSPQPLPAMFAEAKAVPCHVPAAPQHVLAEAAHVSPQLSQALLKPGFTGWMGVLPLCLQPGESLCRNCLLPVSALGLF